MAISVAILALAALLQAPDPHWDTVISQEGKFLIEMPIKPDFHETKTRTGPGGRVGVIIIGCATESGVYLVEKIEFPTAIARGAEQTLLDEMRDDFALEYVGKVLTEKQVRMDGRLGRDFLVRGQKPGQPVKTIRIRMYLEGKAIYAMVVIAAPNRDLPDDVGRFFGSFEFGTKKERVDKPAKELAGKPIEGWGIAVDPFGDSQFKADGKSLTIDVLGVHKDEKAAGDESLKTPRVLREAEGNFSVRVKVAGDFKPEGNSSFAKFVPYNGAGLLAWSDGDNFIRFERAAMKKGGKLVTYANLEEWEGGGRGASYSGPLPPGTVHMRLERKGGKIIAGVSPDGAKWTTLRPIDVSWPAKAKVGIVAVNSNSEPLSARFEELTVNGK